MNKPLTGSICLTDLINEAKAQHSAFKKADNGKIYTSILVWQNDEPDKYGNTMSFQLSSSKEMKDKEKKVYIGNAKPMPVKSDVPVKQNDMSGLPDSYDLPF